MNMLCAPPSPPTILRIGSKGDSLSEDKYLKLDKSIEKLREEKEALEKKLFFVTSSLGMHNIDTMYSKVKRFESYGGDYKPNYFFPKSLNEKIGYYMYNYINRSPCGMAVGHKYLVKQWIKKWVGEKYVVPLFGVWDRPNDIDWDVLPKSFVLKICRGFQGKQVFIVKDKDEIDKEEMMYSLQKEIDKLSAGYKKKIIIAEKLLLNPDDSLPYQYEFYCGRGNPLVCRVSCYSPDNQNAQILFYDIHDWQKLPVQYYLPQIKTFAPNDMEVENPKNLDEMLRVSAELSSHFPVTRIDLYSVGNRVYVGEITKRPGGGNYPIIPSEWDFRFGEGVELLSLHEIEKLIQADILEYSHCLDEIR